MILEQYPLLFRGITYVLTFSKFYLQKVESFGLLLTANYVSRGSKSHLV